METNKPIQTFRDGAVGASVWHRETKAGSFYDVTFSRSYKDAETGEAGYSQTFYERNLDTLVKVTQEAAQWIRERQVNSAQGETKNAA